MYAQRQPHVPRVAGSSGVVEICGRSAERQAVGYGSLCPEFGMAYPSAEFRDVGVGAAVDLSDGSERVCAYAGAKIVVVTVYRHESGAEE